MPISDKDDAALADLRWHWDSAYEISHDGGAWTARFLEGTATLSASSADELRDLVREDYWERKASARRVGQVPGGMEAAVCGAGELALRRLIDEGII
jgi:hypothetical protein